MDSDRLLEIVQQENLLLREKVAFLENALMGVRPLPVEWRLTGQEQRVFGVLVNRELATKDAIMIGLYGDRIDGGAEPKIVDVFICKMRKKLTPFGVPIETIWGKGYMLPKEHRETWRKYQEAA